MLQSVPNCGKIYYGEDLQMVEIVKNKLNEGVDFEVLVNWCE